MSLRIHITENADGGASIEINTKARKLQILPTSGRTDFLLPEHADRRFSVIDTPRFVKVGAAGESLPPDAARWSAVHDTSSGLIWSAENVSSKRLDHAKAAAACSALDLAGAKDWRLPTRSELLTLVDDTRHEPAIDVAFFPKTDSNWYWTSTPCAWRPGSAAWCVYFSNGLVDYLFRDYECFVRAVRVASPAAGQ